MVVWAPPFSSLNVGCPKVHYRVYDHFPHQNATMGYFWDSSGGICEYISARIYAQCQTHLYRLFSGLWTSSIPPPSAACNSTRGSLVLSTLFSAETWADETLARLDTCKAWNKCASISPITCREKKTGFRSYPGGWLLVVERPNMDQPSVISGFFMVNKALIIHWKTSKKSLKSLATCLGGEPGKPIFSKFHTYI